MTPTMGQKVTLAFQAGPRGIRTDAPKQRRVVWEGHRLVTLTGRTRNRRKWECNIKIDLNNGNGRRCFKISILIPFLEIQTRLSNP